MKKIRTGEEFLNLVFKDMKDKIKSDYSDPILKIKEYLTKLDVISKGAKTNEAKKELLKQYCYDKYLIKELPYSYIKYRKGYFYDLGLKFEGEITQEARRKALDLIINEQKESLDELLEFVVNDSNMYPTWFNYYIFINTVKIGHFYSLLNKFTKRSTSTTDPFIKLDEKVIQEVYDIISKFLSNSDLTPEEEKLLLKGLEFKNLYGNIYRKYHKDDDCFDEEEIDVSYYEESEQLFEKSTRTY